MCKFKLFMALKVLNEVAELFNSWSQKYVSAVNGKPMQLKLSKDQGQYFKIIQHKKNGHATGFVQIKSEPAGEYLCVIDDELKFQKYCIENQYWEINNNRIYFGTDRRICLSVNSNNDQHLYTLAESQNKYWGGANQKFDVVIQRIRDFHKEPICNGEVRNIQIRVHGKDEMLTSEQRGMTSVTFKTRDPNSKSQKWILVPSVTYDSNRRFKLGSQKAIGKYLTYDIDQEKLALKADCWDTWEFKDGKLLFFDEDGRSKLGGTVVKSGLTLLLSEVYSFKDWAQQSKELHAQDLESALLDTLFKIRARLNTHSKVTKSRNLIGFIIICVKYLPNTEANLKPRLIELVSYVANYTDGYRDDLFVQNKDSIKLSDYEKSLESAGITDDSIAYVSCRGRIINKRGYPSAFWQLLHYITAQAEDQEAKRVAEILSEFTSTFYYCNRSATSFELAMEENPPHKVHDTKSLVMWLWRIHNHINQELMVDINLDLNMFGEKESPKVIYPPEKSQHFPRSEDDIFEYLMDKYHIMNLAWLDGQQWMPDEYDIHTMKI